MDNIDIQILNLLQNNCKLSTQEIADHVALSTTPCFRRIKQLEEAKVINNYVAILNPQSVGLNLTIMLNIGLDSHLPERISNFENKIKTIPEVVQCYLVAGQKADYILKVIVADITHYQNLLLNRLTQIEGVTMVHSSFVLQKIVDKTSLPLDIL